MTDLSAVLPNDIDDPATPSGGNRYDRRVLTGLAALGWSVRELPVRGAWPDPTEDQRATLAETLSAVPDGALVLIDGLIGSAVPEALTPNAERLRLVVLVHMPLGQDGASERVGAPLACAAKVEYCWLKCFCPQEGQFTSAASAARRTSFSNLVLQS